MACNIIENMVSSVWHFTQKPATPNETAVGFLRPDL